MDRRKRLSRAGFTLIEVLVVVLIIGILIGLLVPAVMAAIRKAHEAQVTAEINNLSTALVNFKTQNTTLPPSRIILVEGGYSTLSAAQLATVAGPVSPSGNDTDISIAQLVSRSQQYLSRIWPRVDFINGKYDFNGNGTIDSGYFILSGSECLTFFLGGVPLNNGNGTFAVTGFSKSPLNPFQNSTQQTNRTVPFYEFVSGRLIDQDGDGFPSYIDPLNTVAGSRRAYAYFFSYGANAYDPNDVNGYGHSFDQSGTASDAGDFEVDDNLAGTFTEWGFQVGYPLSTGTSGVAVSPAPNPYLSSASVTTGGAVSWINPASYQILCAGQDGFWGPGGTYTSSGSGGNNLPIPASNPPNTNGLTNRVRENDNLTNFSGGRLN